MSSSEARDLHRRRLAGAPLMLLDIRENHEFARRHHLQVDPDMIMY